MGRMGIPDFQKYADKFSQKGFFEKIQRIAKRAGIKLVYVSLLLYYLLLSGKLSLKDKALIIGALGYLISPLDFMPDTIPIAGLGDDLTVLLYVLHKVWHSIDTDIKQQARDKLSQWFDEDEMVSAEDILKDDSLEEPV